MRKRTLVLLAIAGALAGSAAAATPALVEPTEGPAGSRITITGPPGPVTLEPLDGSDVETLGAVIPASGTILLAVPDAPAGTHYRVVVAGAGEAPVLTVTEKLDEQTSALLLGFGLLLVLALGVGGIIVHRRWHDAIS